MKKSIGNKESIEKKVDKALRKELLKDNILRNAKGDIRKNILDIVRGDEYLDPMVDAEGTNPCSPTVLLNQLILDYLQWMNLKYTRDMFAVESGTKLIMSRKKMRKMVKNSEGYSKNMPLLLELMTSSIRKSTKK